MDLITRFWEWIETKGHPRANIIRTSFGGVVDLVTFTQQSSQVPSRRQMDCEIMNRDVSARTLRSRGFWSHVEQPSIGIDGSNRSKNHDWW
jgi:hypothetical protein